MSEVAVRLVFVGSVAAAAVALAIAARWPARARARRVAAAPLDLSHLGDGVVLFSAAPCASCDVARERLSAAGASFREISYEHDPEVHRAVGVTGVPLIVAVRPDGGEAGRIAGRPSKRALDRLLEAAGGK